MTDTSQSAFDFTQPAAEPLAPPERRVWAVGELISSIRGRVESEYRDIRVEGEISNLRPAASGHLYFTLKDRGGQLRVVCFRTNARLLRFRPADGLQVSVRGRISVYEDRGELQMIAESMEPVGAGALQLAFEQLKAKLAAEGLFDAARKKPLPPLPRTIGVITSPSGAALQDILNVLGRRHDSLNVQIYPAQVQGVTAAAEVAAGVRHFNQSRAVEVIIIARGGGSAEDLAAFNDEALARAVAASELPVLSAVGHEVDFTICDFVADLRAPTPSAAAELVAESKASLAEREASLRQRLVRAARFQLLANRQRLSELAAGGALRRAGELVARRGQRVDELNYALSTAMRRQLQGSQRRAAELSSRVGHFDLPARIKARRGELLLASRNLAAAMRQRLEHDRARWKQLDMECRALSPLAILERGYALVFDNDGHLLKDPTRLSPGETVRARLAAGELTARVERSRKL